MLTAALAWPAVAGAGEALPLSRVIDEQVEAAWKDKKITPAPPADDAEFLRRIYFDLAGVNPTYDEAVAFLESSESDKRAKLIDRLLDDPRYGLHQGDVWDMVYFGRNPPGYDTDKRPDFKRWLSEQFANNVPYDKLVAALLRGQGSSVDDGAPLYLVQYRNQPEDAVVAITQTFLGVQLQCARCHDHPYEKWTQLDFYGLAAFLARVEVVTLKKKDNRGNYALGEKSTGDILFSGSAKDATPGKKGEPVKPRFLLGDVLQEPALPQDFKEVKFKSNEMPPAPKFSRKDKLAQWVASADNPYFARAVANRVWAQFMGRGVVYPIIDMTPGNKPSHPKLMDALTAAMLEHHFDLKWYIRQLCNSRTYQLSSRGPVEEANPRWFQRAHVRPLSAEELLESWRVANRYDAANPDEVKKHKPGDRFYGLNWDYMVRFFGTPTTGEGDFQGGLHEHLYLNNGELPRIITRNKGGLMDTLLTSDQPWEKRVDRLFLSVLTRYPSSDERKRFVQFITAGDKPQDNLDEAIWALMSCSEYRFNH